MKSIFSVAINFILLTLAIASGFLGAASFKSFYKDFSWLFLSVDSFLPLLGGALFIALGTMIGFEAFKRMRSS